ncbi:MAG TPA: oxidative damage protection protein [Steroidobacteraceae bacterium]|nr:oxidative damage protection protein [Steroidobacteraceae bacterium]
MPRTVHCAYLKREAPGLERLPYPGELGRRIYDHISAQAWQEWLRHQTMLINEYRLSPIEPKARQFLAEEMEKFLFSGESSRPDAYVAPGREKS